MKTTSLKKLPLTEIEVKASHLGINPQGARIASATGRIVGVPVTLGLIYELCPRFAELGTAFWKNCSKNMLSSTFCHSKGLISTTPPIAAILISIGAGACVGLIAGKWITKFLDCEVGIGQQLKLQFTSMPIVLRTRDEVKQKSS